MFSYRKVFGLYGLISLNARELFSSLRRKMRVKSFAPQRARRTQREEAWFLSPFPALGVLGVLCGEFAFF
jgi:hypothetical protein